MKTALLRVGTKNMYHSRDRKNENKTLPNQMTSAHFQIHTLFKFWRERPICQLIVFAIPTDGTSSTAIDFSRTRTETSIDFCLTAAEVSIYSRNALGKKISAATNEFPL